MKIDYEPKLTLKQAEFNEDVDTVLFTRGPIPKTTAVKLVRCPFEDLIQAEEMKVKLCPHAETCKLKRDLTNCTVPHIHNFFSPGDHLEHSEMTVGEGYSLKTVLDKVAKKRDEIHRRVKAGMVLVKPKRLPGRRVLGSYVAQAGLQTKAETYSVYEFDTAPGKFEKYLPVMTKRERWNAADRREGKRLEYIQLCRDAKIDAMLL